MASALLTLCFFAGLALVSYGCWLAYHPSGFFIGGLLLLLASLAYARGSWAS